MKRHAKANWQGSGKEGKGTVSTETNVLVNTPYSYLSRYKDGKGTNPEELVAAAHAGCFTMKLSFLLTEAGFIPENLDTTCEISHDEVKGEIVLAHLILNAKVPEISQKQFAELVDKAKIECPVSKLLNAKITIEFTLEDTKSAGSV